MYSMHLSILANFVSLEGERRIGLDIHTAASIGDLQVHSTHYLVHRGYIVQGLDWIYTLLQAMEI